MGTCGGVNEVRFICCGSRMKQTFHFHESTMRKNESFFDDDYRSHLVFVFAFLTKTRPEQLLFLFFSKKETNSVTK
jgi:hypothetical protein